MTDHDRTLGQLEGKVDAMHDTLTSLNDKIEKMLAAHAQCRSELKGSIDGHEARIATMEGYIKKAIIVGVALVAGGGAGSQLVTKMIEALSQ